MFYLDHCGREPPFARNGKLGDVFAYSNFANFALKCQSGHGALFYAAFWENPAEIEMARWVEEITELPFWLSSGVGTKRRCRGPERGPAVRVLLNDRLSQDSQNTELPLLPHRPSGVSPGYGRFMPYYTRLYHHLLCHTQPHSLSSPSVTTMFDSRALKLFTAFACEVCLRPDSHRRGPNIRYASSPFRLPFLSPYKFPDPNAECTTYIYAPVAQNTANFSTI